MGSKAMTTQHLIRQRSSLALAAVCGVTGFLLLVSMAWHWADHPQPLFAAWVLVGLALVWSLLVRPAVVLDDDGVTIRNVLRDIFIPWVRVTDVEFRWNLKVFAGDRPYVAWAISSQIERPTGVTGGMFAMLPGAARRVRQGLCTTSRPRCESERIDGRPVDRAGHGGVCRSCRAGNARGCAGKAGADHLGATRPGPPAPVRSPRCDPLTVLTQAVLTQVTSVKACIEAPTRSNRPLAATLAAARPDADPTGTMTSR
jgi:hypothetical protein